MPTTTFISRKDIFNLLGITWYNLDQCVKAGLIHPIKLPRAKYRKYLTKEIFRVFMPGYAAGLRPGKKGGKYEEAMGMAAIKTTKKKR